MSSTITRVFNYQLVWSRHSSKSMFASFGKQPYNRCYRAPASSLKKGSFKTDITMLSSSITKLAARLNHLWLVRQWCVAIADATNMVPAVSKRPSQLWLSAPKRSEVTLEVVQTMLSSDSVSLVQGQSGIFAPMVSAIPRSVQESQH